MDASFNRVVRRHLTSKDRVWLWERMSNLMTPCAKVCIDRGAYNRWTSHCT